MPGISTSARSFHRTTSYATPGNLTVLSRHWATLIGRSSIRRAEEGRALRRAEANETAGIVAPLAGNSSAAHAERDATSIAASTAALLDAFPDVAERPPSSGQFAFVTHGCAIQERLTTIIGIIVIAASLLGALNLQPE